MTAEHPDDLDPILYLMIENQIVAYRETLKASAQFRPLWPHAGRLGEHGELCDQLINETIRRAM